jgi:thioredoxin-dependent peroxiredoxin
MEANKKFAEKYQFNFPLLCDTDKTIGIAYGAAADASAAAPMRISYLIGTDGKIERAYGKVKASDHPAAALSEL